MVHIIQEDRDSKRVLRAKAQTILKKDIGSRKLRGIIRDLKGAMATQDDAVAIAAPQIGHSIRLFLVSKKVFGQENANNDSEPENKKAAARDRVFINPIIVRRSRKKVEADEGCLSVRPLYGIVPRSEKVTLRALDERGEPFTYSASGLVAQIFQHETDHLDGILFTDKARDTWKADAQPSHEKNERASA